MNRLLCCVLAVLAAFLVGCTPAVSAPPSAAPPTPAASVESAPPAPVPLLPEALSVEVGGVTVKVDPMMELLAIVQYLSGYDKTFGLMTREVTSYQTRIEETFGGFREHEAVTFFNEVMVGGFSFDSPPTACLYLERDFSISGDFAGSDYANGRLSTDMEQFRDVMKAFCIDSGFADFFDANRDFYTAMLERYAANFPDWDMTAAMEDYYGKTVGGYTIVLVPLFHPGGFGPSLLRPDGLQLYAIVGPYGTADDIPTFGDATAVSDLVIHEFGHSFVPIFENAPDPVMAAENQRSAYLMEPIQNEMAAMAYPKWPNAYEELVLRAAVIDIVLKNTGVPPEAALLVERKQGFVYIDAVYEVLQDYDAQRDKYPVFDAFVPAITDHLLARYPQ